MNTKVRVNPIVKKDLKIISRSMKFSWGLFAYEFILGIIFFFVMIALGAFTGLTGSQRNTDIYEGYVSFFPIIGVAQLCMISLIVPIFTASSISGERERQTMDVMLTTTISPVSIIIGKITSAVIRVMIFVFASIPLMAVSFVMGGLSWLALFEYLILALVYAIYAGSIGTFCSAVFKKSIPAIIMSYVIYGVIYGLTYIPALLASIVGNHYDYLPLFICTLINPVQLFIMFFYSKIAGDELFDYMISNSKYPGIITWIFNTNAWIIVSCVALLLVSALFVWLASRRIRPGKK